YFPLLFKINASGKTGNAVYLLLASKTIANYFPAKEWLQSFSEFQEDGVPLFGVNLNYEPSSIPGFSEFLNKFSLEHLTLELARRKTDFHYQTIQQIYEIHSPATHLVRGNYLGAFRGLQKAGKVYPVDGLNLSGAKI